MFHRGNSRNVISNKQSNLLGMQNAMELRHSCFIVAAAETSFHHGLYFTVQPHLICLKAEQTPKKNKFDLFLIQHSIAVLLVNEQASWPVIYDPNSFNFFDPLSPKIVLLMLRISFGPLFFYVKFG